MLKFNLSSKIVKDILGIKKNTPTINYKYIADIDNPKDEALYFIYKDLTLEQIIKIKSISHRIKKSLFIIKKGYVLNVQGISIAQTDRPRLALAKILSYIENHDLLEKNIKSTKISKNANIHKSAVINRYVVIEKNVVIEPFCFIGNNVMIKKNTIIKSGAKILRNTTIGENTIIRENSIIGGFGFGIEKDGNNNLRIPHLAGVKIGNFVEIGAVNTVPSGTIYPTIIEDYVKTDDHVHIAHNTYIKKNAIITAGVILSGNVEIGENSWIGINSSFKQGSIVGKNVIVGMGSTVLKSVPNGATIAGNPARNIVELRTIENCTQLLLKAKK
jgi:UDP-3-O-[3-hydroxymyristoyl] glucosamine N-acyltransferase